MLSRACMNVHGATSIAIRTYTVLQSRVLTCCGATNVKVGMRVAWLWQCPYGVGALSQGCSAKGRGGARR